MTDCRFCPGPVCDQSFHAASERLRVWLRNRPWIREARGLPPLPSPQKASGVQAERRKPLSPRICGLPSTDRRPDRVERRGRPRRNPPKPKIYAGKGKGWNRRTDVDDAAILQMRSDGYSYAEIGRELGCDRTLVFQHHRRLVRLGAETGLEPSAGPSVGVTGGKTIQGHPDSEAVA